MAEVGNLRVALSLDDAQFTQRIQDVNRKIRSVESEFKAASAGVDKFGGSLTQLQTNASIIGNKLDLQRQKVEELKRRYDTLSSSQNANAADVDKAYIAYNQATAAMKKTEQQLERVNAQINQQSGTWNQLRNNLQSVGDRMQTLGNNMQQVGSDIATSFGAATLALGAGLGVAVKSAADFESQLSSIKAVSGATSQEMNTLQQLAIKYGASTKYSSLEAAQGIEELIKAGVSIKDIINGGLEGALSLATAGELELADAAEIASTALNAFKDDGLNVVQAANLLAGGANASATSVGELKFGLSQASAVAAGLGLSFKDTTTALSLFANSGLRGSDAGTSLKTMLSNLIPKSSTAIGAMMELGIVTKEGANAFFDAQGNVKSMADIAGVLQNSLKGLNSEQRQLALYSMFGSDAIRGANILYREGADGINKMYAEMSKVTAVSVATEKMNNFKGKMEELKGALETAGISIGNALIPTITKIVAGLQTLIDWFNNLSPTAQKLITIGATLTAILTGIATAVGVILTVVGGAITGFGALSTALAGAVGVAGIFSGAIAVITGPIGIAVAAIAGLIAAGVAIYQNWDTIKTKASEIWGGIQATFSFVGSSIVGAWDGTKEYMSNLWNDITNSAVSAWKGFKSVVLTVVTPLVNGVTNIFNHMRDGLQQILTGLQMYIRGVWEIIKNIFLGVVLLIVDLVTLDFEGLSKDSKAIFQNLKEALGTIWEGIKTMFSGVLATIKGFVAGAWENVKNNTTLVFTTVKNFITTVWEGIKTFFFNAITSIKNFVTNGFESMANSISEKMTTAKQMITSTWASVTKFLREINLSEIGKNIIQGLIDGISSMAGALMQRARDIANSIKDTIKDALDINSPSRVMADEVGRWIPEGLAQGITRNFNVVVNASQRMSDAVIPKNINIPSVNTVGLGGGVNISVAVTGNYINDSVDEERLAQKISRKIADEFSRSVGGTF